MSDHDQSRPGTLQFDLLCAILRIEQVGGLGEDDVLRELLIDRLVTCDAPRLRRYLAPETLAMEDDLPEATTDQSRP